MLTIASCALLSVLLDAAMHGPAGRHIVGVAAVAGLVGLGSVSVLALLSVAVLGFALMR
jgi:hypothetical protein